MNFIRRNGDFKFEVLEHRAQTRRGAGSAVAGGIVDCFVHNAIGNVVVTKKIPSQTSNFHVPLTLQ